MATCRNCGTRLSPSELENYDYQCITCDEDFYEFEAIEEKEETKEEKKQMKKYRVQLDELIKVWQTIMVEVEAESKEEIIESMKRGDFIFSYEWINFEVFDTDWNTQENMDYNYENVDILEMEEEFRNGGRIMKDNIYSIYTEYENIYIKTSADYGFIELMVKYVNSKIDLEHIGYEDFLDVLQAETIRVGYSLEFLEIPIIDGDIR